VIASAPSVARVAALAEAGWVGRPDSACVLDVGIDFSAAAPAPRSLSADRAPTQRAAIRPAVSAAESKALIALPSVVRVSVTAAAAIFTAREGGV